MIERFPSGRPIVISPEVTSPEMLSYLAQNVIMLSRASDDTFIPLVRSHDSLRNMIYYKKLYFLRIYCITPDNISGDLTLRIGRHNSGFLRHNFIGDLTGYR